MSPTVTSVILAISFWFHFIGITIWVGGSLIMPLAIQPAIGSLEPPARMKPSVAIAMKMLPLYIVAIILVFVTGTIQTVLLYKAGPSMTLNIKMLVALLMAANGIYIGLVLGRKVTSLAPAPGTPPSPDFLKAQRMLVMHGWIQFGMAILILLLVGFLRVGL